MPKSYSKKTEEKKNPGYRTADFFKGKTFSGKRSAPNSRFDRTNYKVQHKG